MTYLDDICKIGKGESTCRYLVMNTLLMGMQCAKFTDMAAALDARVAAGTLMARGNNCHGFIGKNGEPGPIPESMKGTT